MINKPAINRALKEGVEYIKENAYLLFNEPLAEDEEIEYSKQYVIDNLDGFNDVLDIDLSNSDLERQERDVINYIYQLK